MELLDGTSHVITDAYAGKEYIIQVAAKDNDIGTWSDWSVAVHATPWTEEPKHLTTEAQRAGEGLEWAQPRGWGWGGEGGLQPAGQSSSEPPPTHTHTVPCRGAGVGQGVPLGVGGCGRRQGQCWLSALAVLQAERGVRPLPEQLQSRVRREAASGWGGGGGGVPGGWLQPRTLASRSALLHGKGGQAGWGQAGVGWPGLPPPRPSSQPPESESRPLGSLQGSLGQRQRSSGTGRPCLEPLCLEPSSSWGSPPAGCAPTPPASIKTTCARPVLCSEGCAGRAHYDGRVALAEPLPQAPLAPLPPRVAGRGCVLHPSPAPAPGPGVGGSPRRQGLGLAMQSTLLAGGLRLRLRLGGGAFWTGGGSRQPALGSLQQRLRSLAARSSAAAGSLLARKASQGAALASRKGLGQRPSASCDAGLWLPSRSPAASRRVLPPLASSRLPGGRPWGTEQRGVRYWGRTGRRARGARHVGKDWHRWPWGAVQRHTAAQAGETRRGHGPSKPRVLRSAGHATRAGPPQWRRSPRLLCKGGLRGREGPLSSPWAGPLLQLCKAADCPSLRLWHKWC